MNQFHKLINDIKMENENILLTLEEIEKMNLNDFPIEQSKDFIINELYEASKHLANCEDELNTLNLMFK